MPAAPPLPELEEQAKDEISFLVSTLPQDGHLVLAALELESLSTEKQCPHEPHSYS
jgi:hypothetical protein